MKSALLLVSIGVLAAAASAPSWASRDEHGDRESGTRTRSGDGVERGVQVVPTNARPGEPGHGWRYYSDPHAHRAVVISPQGEYYYSRGKGLSLVAVTQPGS